MPTLLVHGWWNISGAKMSKSLGNVVDPDALIEMYGAEAVRYYLMSDIVTGKDADFSEERLVTRYNVDLANSLGNLLNRALTMVQRFRKGVIQGRDPLNNSHDAKVSEYGRTLDRHQISDSYSAAIAIVERCNKEIDDVKPWAIARDLEKVGQLDFALYYPLESLRIVAILISPVLPKAAHGIFDQLNWKMELSGKEQRFRLEDAKWGGLPDGHVVGKPVPLFPRIEG
jgi:methionyl-tRNA synthetase